MRPRRKIRIFLSYIRMQIGPKPVCFLDFCQRYAAAREILGFLFYTFQVPFVKSYGSDAILIILSAINNNLAKEIYHSAIENNISD